METLKFKTTINCGGCLAKVTPFLNDEKSIEKWEVNTSSPEKTLTVETEDTDTNKIISAVEKAGFKIEQIKN
jgi:copper chaperone